MWHEPVQLLDVSDDFRQLYRVKSNYLPQIVPCVSQELAALSLDTVEQEPEAKVEEIWKNALSRKRGVRVRFMSYVSGILFHRCGYYCRMVYCHEIDYGRRT
ncbi:hypothetical protein BYT27DRAFT_6840791 [Phlegmacium glaucopus]|nr:hypothetical protein BYT27DRAFT_6840791 [Phlegmacium glaucopus]